MHAKKILIFDFDGTLVDSMQHLTEIAAQVLARHYRLAPAEGRQIYRDTSGLPFFEQLNSVYPKTVKKNEVAAADFEEQKRQNYFREPLFPDSLTTLKSLQTKGYRIAISSNSDDELVQRFIEQLQLPCEVAHGFRPNFDKGEPHFEAIRRHFRQEKSALVFIGDSLKDADKARHFGIDFIAKLGTFRPEDFQQAFPGVAMIRNLMELEAMFP